jgi:hypothetical protein
MRLFVGETGLSMTKEDTDSFFGGQQKTLQRKRCKACIDNFRKYMTREEPWQTP